MKSTSRLLFKIAFFIGLAAPFSCQKSATSTAPKHNDEQPALTAKNPRLQLHRGTEIGLDFENLVVESMANNPTSNINIYNGGGVAVADFNRDGLPDIYLVSSNGPNKFFLNKGKIRFEDATPGSGLDSPDGFETAATVVDINADGWPDIYLSRAGSLPPDECRNRLFINNGGTPLPAGEGSGVGFKWSGTFSEEAKAWGLDIETRSNGANFFDFDLDGDLDVFILNYPQGHDYYARIQATLNPKTGKYYPNIRPETPLDSDRLYENDGKNHFSDISAKAGISTCASGLSVTVSDFNGDHWPDIFVGNDFVQPDILYLNQQNGTFRDGLADHFQHTSRHTMGADAADFDNDGLVDFTAMDMLPRDRFRLKTTANTASQTGYLTEMRAGYFPSLVRNVLQRNNGDGSFSDIASLAGVAETDWSWSPLFMDLDNDGLKDLGITNGYRREVTNLDFINFTLAGLKNPQKKTEFSDIESFLKLIPTFKTRNFMFRNRGDWTFEDMGGDWATMPASFSNGAAWADFDADGDLDWLVSNLADAPFLYENLSRARPASNFLQVKLEGIGQNSLAVGASAWLEAGGQIQFLEMQPTRGIFSSVEHLFHFGLGEEMTAEKLTIRWPDGKSTTLENVAANQKLTLKWAESTGIFQKKPSPTALFKNTTASSGVQFRHAENPFSDFDASFLLPWQFSDLGPALVSGDANGDGLDDFFVGNGFGQAAGLFLQTANGTFRRSSQPVWEAEKGIETIGGLFFDADNDGDNDLILTAGGFEMNSAEVFQARFFMNDGQGNFTKTAGLLPKNSEMVQKVAAHDFDGDGDLDLFLGGRVRPRFPEMPRSMVWKNGFVESGKKKIQFDEASKTAGDFARCGMVTGLVWANLDGDAAPEMVVCGEWMPVSIFKMDGGRLKNVTQNFGLEKSEGLWQSLAAADLDGDGDLDLATGNFGLNTRLRASENEPLQLFASDFDQNGSLDPILCLFSDGKNWPAARQDMMIKQLPVLKKRFIYARDYAAASFEDIFSADQKKGMIALAARTTASTWWENRGGKFTPHALPMAAQVSPALGLALGDLTGDGKPDIFVCGNRYGVEVQTGRCDASVGCLLAGDGKGNFTALPNPAHGLRANLEARDVAVLRGPGGRKTVVVVNNSEAVQVFGRQ